MALTESHQRGYRLFIDETHREIVHWFLSNQTEASKLPPPFHTSRYSTVWRIDRPARYFIKRFRPAGLLVRLKDSMRGSRAMRAWRAGEMLERAGFHAPPVAALGERRILGLLTDAFLITLPLPGVSLLERLLPVEDFREKRRLIAHMGREIGRLHQKGIIHGDLIPGNIFATDLEAPLSFLDNERTREFRRLPLDERIKNLVQLNRVVVPRVTAADRVRFFDAYLTEHEALRPERKSLLRRIGGITSERVMRHRGIPVEKRSETTFRAVMAWRGEEVTP